MRTNVLIITVACITALVSILICISVKKDNDRVFEMKRRQISAYHNLLFNIDSKESGIDVPIYYINMDKSVDRRNAMEDQSKQLGLFLHRIKGVDANSVPGTRSLTNSEIACCLAHLKAIYTAYAKGDQIALIVEDDTSLMLSQIWEQPLTKLLERAPADWRVINLAPTFNKRRNPKEFERFDPQIPAWGCWAYVINRAGMLEIMRKTNDGYKLTIEPENMRLSDMLIYNNITGSYEYHGRKLFYLLSHHLPSTITPNNQQVFAINQSYAALEQYSGLSRKMFDHI